MELFEKMRSLYNGDIRVQGTQHICKGCCAGARQCALKMSDLTVEAIVRLIPDKLGSTSKHHTMEQECMYLR